MAFMDRLKSLSWLRGQEYKPAEGQASAAPAPEEKAPDEGEPLKPLSDGQLARWKSRIETAKHQLAPYWDKYDQLRAEYIGPEDPRFKLMFPIANVSEGRPINFLSSYVNTTMPQVLPANPLPVVEQAKGGDEYREGAKRLQARLIQVFKRKDTLVQLRRAVFDAYLGMGWVLVSWQPNTSAYVPEQKSEGDQPIDMSASPRAARSASSEKPRPDEPVLRHISFKNMLFNTDLEQVELDSSWLGYQCRKRLADVKANPIYHDTDDLRGDEPGDASDSPRNNDEMVTLYVIFHRGRESGEVGVLVLAGDHKVEIRHEYVRMGLEGFPLRSVGFYDVGEGMPANPVQFWVDLHSMANAFAAEMTERASEAKRVIVVPDEATADSLEHVKGNDIIISKDSQLVKQFEMGGTHADTPAMFSIVKQWLDMISGIDDMSRGLSGGNSETATKTQLIYQSAQNRITSMQENVGRFLSQLAKDMSALLLEHQWQDVEVPIKEGVRNHRYEIFNNREVPGTYVDYTYNFNVVDYMRITPALKQKRAQDTLALLADPNIQGYAQAEGRQISVIAALEDKLESDGIVDVERYIMDQQTPEELQQMQIEKAQLENQEMLATGTPAIVDIANDDHQIHGMVHMELGESPAAAEHMAEHYAILEQLMGMPSQLQGNPNIQGQPQGGQQIHNGPAQALPRGMRQDSEAELAGQAASY